MTDGRIPLVSFLRSMRAHAASFYPLLSRAVGFGMPTYSMAREIRLASSRSAIMQAKKDRSTCMIWVGT